MENLEAYQVKLFAHSIDRNFDLKELLE